MTALLTPRMDPFAAKPARKPARCVACRRRRATRPRDLCDTCSRVPEVRGQHPLTSTIGRPPRGESDLPSIPAGALPGAPAREGTPEWEERIREMERRASLRQSLFGAADAAPETRLQLVTLALHERVIYLRRRKEWTAAQLAEQAGLTRMTIWRVELGRTEPTLETLQALARALGCPLNWLLGLPA